MFKIAQIPIISTKIRGIFSQEHLYYAIYSDSTPHVPEIASITAKITP